MSIMEREVEARLRDMVRSRGGFCLKWVCPGWSGVPDRIILLPGGRIIFVELKRPEGGRLSSRQVWWGRKLTQLGFEHHIIWNIMDIKRFEADLGVGGEYKC